jgi:hypothetical protein
MHDIAGIGSAPQQVWGTVMENTAILVLFCLELLLAEYLPPKNPKKKEWKK